MKHLKSKQWWEAATVRAIKTGAQVLTANVLVGAFNGTDWIITLQTIGTAMIVSYATSLAGLPEVDE